MSTFKSKDKFNLYYKDWGQGEDPIIFSHGWPLNADMWDYQMYFLANSGYRSIAFDRRGFGRSEQPWISYDYDTFSDDIHCLIEYLGLSKVTLVGFSMGCGDVSRYISRFGTTKVKKIILLGTITPMVSKNKDNPDGIDKSIFDTIKLELLKDRPQFIKQFIKTFYGNMFVSDGIKFQTLNISLLASLKATIDCVTSFSETNFYNDLSKINIPTLIIHGSNDQILPYQLTSEQTHKLIPNSKLKLYKNGPHGFVLTHQDHLKQDIISFLQE
ncbi:alpha/beta hydrolase [Candidatus Pantoea edessiphila]|uniref:Alpha/beta hydrolase n=1 Tax=Candidatus Pantoea edessiphila TaxID=2044610 RepID=A0A2P5SXU1_9GAMM|nr:alpha/beta hydrolase [Candidatus Pantoea edessiphila]MBK4775749.1 alpha/beta hydrolase [Pantoea sp. Edef]PPI87145.1 alpha/beta hydrolase [Candidatus Pantoea edessiphila]